eukprot:5000005-Amphidinium_carterae.2
MSTVVEPSFSTCYVDARQVLAYLSRTRSIWTMPLIIAVTIMPAMVVEKTADGVARLAHRYHGIITGTTTYVQVVGVNKTFSIRIDYRYATVAVAQVHSSVPRVVVHEVSVWDEL